IYKSPSLTVQSQCRITRIIIGRYNPCQQYFIEMFKFFVFATMATIARAGAPVAFAAAPAHLTYAAPAAHLAYAAPPTPIAYAAPAPVAKAVAVADADYDPNPQYSYSYNVEDALTGDSKNQFETRNGDSVQGSYSLTEPDGTRRIVEYTADSVNGFNAVVHKEPLAKAVAVAPVAYAAQPTPVAYAAHPTPVAYAAHPSPVAYAAHSAPVAYATHPAPVAYATHPAPVAYATHSAPVAYAAHPTPFAYTAGAQYATGAITSQSSNIHRSFGNLGQVSTYTKTIDTPFSSVSKADVRVSNPGVKYAAAATPVAYAAPAVHAAPGPLLGVAYSSAPAVAHVSYAANIGSYEW
ncbi:chitin-binding domain-containing protein, partial [Devosia marina]